MAQTTPEITPTLVFVPNLLVHRGLGHLKRCLKAAAVAGPGAVVYYSESPEFAGNKPVFDRSSIQALADRAGVPLWSDWSVTAVVQRVVVDLQSTSRACFEFLRARAQRLIGWDEGGPCRKQFPCLVDSLPHDTDPPPNLRMPGLLGLRMPPQAPRFDRPIRKILAVFGGADPSGLTLRFLNMVARLRQKERWHLELTVVRGPLSDFIVPPGTTLLEAPADLSSLLGDYDLTVTSWGLTALESLAAGTPVLLLNPTDYHQRLSQAAGLPSFGVRRPQLDQFLSGIAQSPDSSRRAYATLIHPPVDAGEYFKSFQGSDGFCPVCRTHSHPVFARTEHKSFHLCRNCGMEYLSVHQLPTKQYTESYFLEDYQKQYGKTYLQDFPHIQGLGKQRLSFLMKTTAARKGSRLLDVGCAYGPFLAAAADSGFLPYGLDIAQPAVDYVKDQLGFPATAQGFLEFDWEGSFANVPRPEVLTMWYVIEHFPDLEAVLRKVGSLLPVGGVFAFSTPNGRGITRTFSPQKFWKESPDDHFSIWSPQNTRSVLRRFGFEVKAYRITGRHPERFPGLTNPRHPLLPWISLLDRWLGWGDTFEVYAQKTKETL